MIEVMQQCTKRVIAYLSPPVELGLTTMDEGIVSLSISEKSPLRILIVSGVHTV